MPSGILPQPAEIDAVQAVERQNRAHIETVKRFLATNERILSEIDAIKHSQAAAWVASTGAQATLDLLSRINGGIIGLREDIKELWSAVESLTDSVEQSGRRKPTGLTDRLRLTEEAQRELDAAMQMLGVNDQAIVTEWLKWRAHMDNRLERIEQRSIPILRLVWERFVARWKRDKGE